MTPPIIHQCSGNRRPNHDPAFRFLAGCPAGAALPLAGIVELHAARLMRAGTLPPALIVGTGVVSALNYGKLPPALPALQADFELSLVQVSWMVSLFMIAAAVFGMMGGAIADRFGLRRIMVSGLALSALAGLVGALADTATALLASRALESLGFLLAVLPGPALLRHCVPAASLRGWLGIWSAYMPTGMGVALIATPWLMASGGWRTAWWLSAAMAFLWAVVIAVGLPGRPASAGPVHGSLAATARATATSIGPWLISLCFLFYAGQFVGIFSFLPSIYLETGLAPAVGGLLTALAVIANVTGNLASGLLLQHGWRRESLIAFAGVTMALCAWLAFGAAVPFALRYAAVVILSAVGGLIPGALFATAPFYAPDASAVSTTVGLMQQGSAWGQILLPPLIAAVAQHTGGWSSIWIATGLAAACTVLIARAIGRYDQRRFARARG